MRKNAVRRIKLEIASGGMNLNYSDIYGLEPEYDPEQQEYGEVVLTEDDFLEQDTEEQDVPVLDLLETGTPEKEEEWEPDIVERGWEPSDLDRAAAHAYAYTTVTGFRMLESSFKATFRTLEFLARRI